MFKNFTVLAFVTAVTPTTIVANEAFNPTHCVINSPSGVNVRLSPNPYNASNIVGQIKNGQPVHEFQRFGEWSNIGVIDDSSNNNNVYINNKYIGLVDTNSLCP